MAKTSNLREFQEAILQKLKDASTQTDEVSTSRLGVTIGVHRVLVNLNDVTEVLPVPPLQEVPLTQPWFLGVANIRGNLYNITDLAQFMGLPPTPKSANSRVVLINSEVTTQAAFVVGSLIGLRNINNMRVKSNGVESHDLFGKYVFEDLDGNAWVELDMEALEYSQSFTQPTMN